MDMKDTLQLQAWLRARLSLAEVEAIEPVGLVGNSRFSPAAVRAFRLLWRWSAPRLTDPAQDRYVDRCGRAARDRRIERCRHHIARLSGRDLA